MAIVDTSARTKRDAAANLYKFIDNFGDGTLANALVSFGVSGAVKWNDADALYSAVSSLFNTIDQVVSDQTDAELTANWELVEFVNVPGIRTDIIAIQAALGSLLDLIELNTNRMSFSYVRSPTSSKTYDLLTNGERAAVKAQLDAIQLTMKTRNI